MPCGTQTGWTRHVRGAELGYRGRTNCARDVIPRRSGISRPDHPVQPVRVRPPWHMGQPKRVFHPVERC